MLLHLLHQLPDVAILALAVIVVAGITMAAPHVRRRVLRLANNDERDEAAFDGLKMVMSMAAIVLAFCLVQANGNLREVDATVAKEAAAISITDRALLRFGKPEATELRSVLADYAAAVVDEWPSLARRERSEAADAAYTALSKKTRAMAPDDARQEAMYHELLKDLDDLSDLREETLTESDYRLPTIFWVTAGCLLALGGRARRFDRRQPRPHGRRRSAGGGGRASAGLRHHRRRAFRGRNQRNPPRHPKRPGEERASDVSGLRLGGIASDVIPAKKERVKEIAFGGARRLRAMVWRGLDGRRTWAGLGMGS
jgi:hypothetical protein